MSEWEVGIGNRESEWVSGEWRVWSRSLDTPEPHSHTPDLGSIATPYSPLPPIPIPTTRRTAMPNPFVHVELNTTDVDKAKKFYGQLFDWELEDVEMGPTGRYTMIKTGGTGGGMLNPGAGMPSFWLAYVDVEDVAAATKKAQSLGARVMRDVTEVQGAGVMSIIVDPTGAMLALWKGISDGSQ